MDYFGRTAVYDRPLELAPGITVTFLDAGHILGSASVHTINGFSMHADRDELLAWHAESGAARTFLVHGEPEVMQQFAAHLQVPG